MGKIDFIREKGWGMGCIRIFCILAGSYWIIEWIVGRIFLFYNNIEKHPSNIIGKHVGKISFVILLGLGFPKWLSEYPGIMTPDSIWQVQQVLGMAPLNSHHPIIHTLWIKLWYEIGNALGFQDNISIFGFVSLVQLMLHCAILALIIKHIYKKTQNVFMVFMAVIFYGLIPFNTSYAVTFWKDIIHAWVAALFLITLDSYMENAKMNVRKQILYTVMLVILGVAFCLFRNNGYYAILLWSVLICIFMIRNKNYLFIVITLLIIAVSTFVRGPVYSNMNVVKGGYAENLSIPMQQIAYVIVNGREIDADERELLQKVVNIDEVPSKYVSYLSDPVKFMCNVDSGYFVEHKAEYLKLWIKIGIRYPMDYLTAFIKQTYGYYYPDTSYWVYADGITQNDMGIEQKSILSADMVEKIRNWGGDIWGQGLHCGLQIPLYGSFFNVATYTWILICMMLYVLYRRRWSLFFQFSLLLCVFATLMIATPVYAEFRYYYSVVICLPWLLFAPMAKD